MLVHGVPKLLTALSIIGTAAMLWVGGGILLHGLEELHLAEAVPHAIHDAAHAIAVGVGIMPGAVEWIANAIGAAIAGFIVGIPIVFAVKQLRRRRTAAHAA